MKKKAVSGFIMLTMVLGLAACGSAAGETDPASTNMDSKSENTDTPTAEVPNTEILTAESEDTETSTAESEDTEGKTLVVYYSATGNTENVAHMIAEKTGGDIFELVPVEPYTDAELNWTDSNSRVSVEHENEDERNVELQTTSVPDWDTYDTVYIGYPIWWGIAAWPMDNFVKENDFSGKTVLPFATAASSGIGQSGELLQEMAGTGDWLEGECFRGIVTMDDINEWIDAL